MSITPERATNGVAWQLRHLAFGAVKQTGIAVDNVDNRVCIRFPDGTEVVVTVAVVHPIHWH